MVPEGNLQNLESQSQTLNKQPRTKWKSTTEIWREELEAKIFARVGGNGVGQQSHHITQITSDSLIGLNQLIGLQQINQI